ncbi:MAG TPA: hypothetical protein VE081_02995 [Sporichthyaceae bacterium]|nr:hypothetical protein [Sporichthyaceae bacterium]
MSEDADLLAAVAAVHDRLDPMPDYLREAARAVFALRDPDAVLATLVADVGLEESGVRAGGGPRMLSFRAGQVMVELQVHERGARRRVLGQLSPAGPGRLRVQSLHEHRDVVPDALGRFVLDDLPAGTVRLRWEPASGPAVVTRWTTL